MEDNRNTSEKITRLTQIEDFNIEHVEFGIPEEVPIKDSETGVYYKCTIIYNFPDGKQGDLILESPKVFCYGIQKEYKYAVAKTPENFKGYNLCYNLSDPNTDASKRKPQTPEQKKYASNLLKIQKKLTAHLKEYADLLAPKAGDLARNEKLVSHIARYPQKEEPALTKDGKPIFAQGKQKMKKVPDKSKPQRMYPKMLVNKKTEKFITKFYGPGDRELDPLVDCYEVWGDIEPSIKLEYVYIGDSATFQIKVYDATFTPSVAASKTRLAKKNTVKIENVEETSDPNLELDDPLSLDKEVDKPVVKTTKSEVDKPAAKTTKAAVRRKAPVKKIPIKKEEDEEELVLEE